jgi:hypothetical protein
MKFIALYYAHPLRAFDLNQFFPAASHLDRQARILGALIGVTIKSPHGLQLLTGGFPRHFLQSRR